jgi:hypothetical protein
VTEHKTAPTHDENSRERQRISVPAPKHYEQAVINTTPFSVAQESLAALQRIEALLLRQIERQGTNAPAFQGPKGA